MNPIDTWIDTDEVRRLAGRLISPERQAPEKVRESGFDDSFVGFADLGESNPSPVSSPAVVAMVASPAPEPAAETTIKLPKPVAEKPTPISTKFDELSGWLRENCDASAVFVTDLDGSILHDEGCAHLHFAARSMASNWKLGQSANPLRLLVNAGSYLQLIPVNHPQGRLILGVIVAQPVSPITLAAIREKASMA